MQGWIYLENPGFRHPLPKPRENPDGALFPCGGGRVKGIVSMAGYSVSIPEEYRENNLMKRVSADA